MFRTFTDILAILQYKLDKELIQTIFTYNSEHIFSKWVIFDGNLLSFFWSLDETNQNLLLQWSLQNLID